MNHPWGEVPLSAVCSVLPGFAFKSTDWSDTGTTVIRIGDIQSDRTVAVVGATKVATSLPLAPQLRRFALRDGDIVLAMTGATAGKVGKLRLSEPALLNQRVAKLTPTSVDANYFWALISSDDYEKRLFRLADGAAQPNMSASQIERLMLPNPPATVQRGIGRVMSAYDDLIEMNRRRVAILEEMARRLFEEWFVQFRLPGQGRVLISTQSVRQMPDGWRMGNVADLIDIDPRTSLPRDGLKPFIPMGSLNTRTSFIDGIERREGSSGAKFQNGDTLFARITPCLENGKTGLVRDLPGEGVGFGSTEFIVMRGRIAGPAFTYLLARYEPFRQHAQRSMSGATGRQRARTESVRAFALPVPPADILERFEQLMWPLLGLVGRLGSANLALAAARYLLLPRLISGELSVAGAPTGDGLMEAAD